MRSRRFVGLPQPIRLLLMMVAVVFGLCSSPASAQTFYGSIVGTVTDATGAVVQGATVTITNLGTNDVQAAKTDTAGDYRFVNLVPANYRVVVETSGFKRFERQSVEVVVDTTARVNAALQIGAATETVEVGTQAALLQTESGSLGDTIGAKQMDSMPLNGRNAMNLMELVPGVIPQGSSLGSAAANLGATTGSVGWGNYQIGGGIPTQSSTYVDGAPTQIMQKNTNALVPTQDTVQEFTVETSGVSPEFGRFGGGVVNMTTKSGTNQFHGTAYEYVRNKDVNANNYFFNRSNLARPEFTENQFGGAVGGPIWKKKAFFFVAYELNRIRQAALEQTNIPTAAEQAGVIADPASGGSYKKIVDLTGNCNIQPYTGQTVTGPTGQSETFAAGGYYITNLFQAGSVSGTCGDPTAKIFRTFYPYNTLNANSSYNYITPYSESDNTYQLSGRFDYDLTSKQRAFARFTLWNVLDSPINIMQGASGYPTHSAGAQNHTNQIVVGDTYTFNPTTVLEFRADYMRQDSVPPGYQGTNEAQWGAPFAALAPYMNYQHIPGFSLAGTGQLHNIFNFGYTGVQFLYYNNYHVSGALTKMLGKHTLKMGAEVRLMQRDDVGNDGSPSGSFTYGDDLSGDEWSNFLMGQFDSDTITSLKRTTSYDWYSGYYIQDTWQAARKLTLNLGLRVEMPGAIAENANNASVLLPNAVDPYTGITGTAALVQSSLYPGRTTQVSPGVKVGPRVGFAYRLTDSTVVRGGYSLSYLTPDYQTGTYAETQSINSAATTHTNVGSTITYTMGVNPFPITTQYPLGMQLAQGRANPAFMVANIGQAVTDPYPFEPFPTSQSMNVSIGHQMKGDTLIDVGFAHTLGTHLPRLSDGLDELPDQYDSLGTALAANKTPGGTPINLAYDSVTLPTALQTYGQSLLPFPAYKNFSNGADFNGTLSYNALEVKVQKRFKAAGQFGAAYTWMKMIGDADSILTGIEAVSAGVAGAGHGTYQDYNNLKAERSIYSFDAPNRLVFNYVYNLPFGHGQRFGANTNGVVERVISAWSLSGITTFQSGYPVYMYTSGNNLSKNLGAGTIRPNYTPGCAKTIGGSGYARTQPGATWFNTTCFTLPGTPGSSATPSSASYGFGNEPRTDDAIKSGGVDNFDLSVIKSIPIHESIALQLRVEGYNIFNRVQFGPPVTEADAPNALFGVVSSQANNPRELQGALRVNF
jgi:hypothetical protein